VKKEDIVEFEVSLLTSLGEAQRKRVKIIGVFLSLTTMKDRLTGRERESVRLSRIFYSSFVGWRERYDEDRAPFDINRGWYPMKGSLKKLEPSDAQRLLWEV
jgi:hypothetical protein